MVNKYFFTLSVDNENLVKFIKEHNNEFVEMVNEKIQESKHEFAKGMRTELTSDEFEILKKIDKIYNYISRDTFGNLSVHCEKPEKFILFNTQLWLGGKRKNFNVCKKLFDSITVDDSPYDIGYLLKFHEMALKDLSVTEKERED